MGTHLRVLCESYPMNTNMSGFRWFKRKKIHLRFIARFRFHILVVVGLWHLKECRWFPLVACTHMTDWTGNSIDSS